MDSRGNITLEITIVLVVILMITGIILNSIEFTTDKIIKTTQRENIESLISETVDNIVNNPGSQNWEEYGNGNIGLAIINEQGETIPNSISYSKFIALGNDYKKLVDDKLFDSKLKTSMEIIPQESSISSVKIGNLNDGNNIFSVNRLIKCDFYKKYVLKDFLNEGKCNHNHEPESYSCNYFKVFPGNLRSSDYYLLIDSDENDLKYMIDTTRVVKPKFWMQTSDMIYLNDKIDFYDDSSAVVFIHFDKKDAKAVLVSIPKNFDKSKISYDYFRTNNCKFILKASLN